MNSKLLEEAIIDAEALRSAALKSAEQAVLEKYAPEVKSAVENLLEQEDTMAGGAMPPLGGDMSAQQPELDVPLAATDEEKLCPCPDDNEVITISLGDLEDAIKKTVADTARASATPGQEEEMPMDMAPDLDMEPELPAPEEEEEEEPAPLALQEDFEISEELIASILSESEEEIQQEELEEEVELQEENEEIVEEEKPEDNKEMMEENKSLSTQNSKLLVEQQKTTKQNKLLTEQLTKLLEQHNKILEENKQFKETMLKVSQKLEESNLLNAKLHFKNQALSSDSLNERQKNKIVEAISQAGSVDEAKMVYETLCNAVGSFDSKGPQSLSEAVERKGGLTLKPRQKQESNQNPMYNKWQKIAGIKK